MPDSSGQEITLEELLLQRDTRQAMQRALLARFTGKPLLCLLVNMPGPIKRTPESDRVFYTGLAACKAALHAAHIPILYEDTRALIGGAEGYLVPDADAQRVKRIACELETELPYGRLLDIDVHAPDGKQVSRTALGFPERGCMVCGAEGAYCASRRKHPVTALVAAFNRIAETAREATQ